MVCCALALVAVIVLGATQMDMWWAVSRRFRAFALAIDDLTHEAAHAHRQRSVTPADQDARDSPNGGALTDFQPVGVS
jgi:hypothetical protein